MLLECGWLFLHYLFGFGNDGGYPNWLIYGAFEAELEVALLESKKNKDGLKAICCAFRYGLFYGSMANDMSDQETISPFTSDRDLTVKAGISCLS